MTDSRQDYFENCTEETPNKKLYLCERRSHLPDHDGGTGYFYYVPVEQSMPEEVTEAEKKLRNMFPDDWDNAWMQINILIKAARQVYGEG